MTYTTDPINPDPKTTELLRDSLTMEKVNDFIPAEMLINKRMGLRFGFLKRKAQAN